ncbi:MAG: hypothetical protein OEM97_04090 [Acidimicrobiia bacterium]|nr:hypothetical protein [Acidimicrobiia bacterium]
MAAFRRLIHWALVAIPLLASCVGTSAVVIGESPLPPLTNIPVVPVAVVDETGEPVPEAMITVGDEVFEVDTLGVGLVEWQGRPMNVSIRAPGFFPGALAVEEFSNEPIALELRPVVLRGTVTDSDGRPLTGATVALGERTSITDDDGVFHISKAVPGELAISRPGWHDTTADWDGQSLATSVALDPRIIRGLHVAGVITGNEEEWNKLLKIAEETVVNSLVIDIKDETGRVFYDTEVELAREVDAVEVFYDLADVINDLEQRDLYIIGRIVSFQDPIAAQRAPELAVFDTATGSPYQNRGQFFLDPTDGVARRYALDLAVEACEAGVDEIQFDYVRYPDGFPASARFDGGAAAEDRAGFIATFLDDAGRLLHPMGCSVAADIFGFITSVENDGGIGQQFEMLSEVTDVLSPMLYPSHYSEGWFGFSSPNDNPGPVIANALDDGLPRLEGAAIVRPWLQDFFYDSTQVRAQIDAAEARSVGWMLWNASSNFQTDAIELGTPADGPATDTTAAATGEVEAHSDGVLAGG